MTQHTNASKSRKGLPTAGRAPKAQPFTKIEVSDLAAVIYTSGKVFEGLRTDRLDTENFLRSGSTEGVTSRQDLHVLQDLRDVAQLVISHRGQPIDASFACAVNETISRSGSMYPGRLRTAEQGIGVNTAYGRHEPPAIDEHGLQRLLDNRASMDPQDRAVHLFVDIAKAQPFWDGNKRTALFIANAVLLEHHSPQLLTIPFEEHNPSVARSFNDSLARAYRFDELDDVATMLREQGFSPLKPYRGQPGLPQTPVPAGAATSAAQTPKASLEALTSDITSRVAALKHDTQSDQVEL